MSEGLAEGSRGAAGTLWRRMGANLVVIELATAVVLLTGAGLLGRSLFGLLHVDLGFAADHLAILHVGLPERAFSKDEQVVGFERQLIERVKNLPGVESAALTSLPAVSCNCITDWVRFVGKPYNGVHNEVNSRDVTAGFFTTIHAKLVSGRFFTEGEDGTKPLVTVVNETFARKYFPGEDPIGKIMGDTVLTPKTLRRIVGVVADFKDEGLDDPHWPAEYIAFEQSTDTDFSLMVRTKHDPASILPLLGSTVHGVSLLAGVEEGTSLDERVNDSYTAYIHRSTAWLVGGFAALALGLSVSGPLRGNCLLGGPADAGDWRADGARSAAQLSVFAGAWRGCALDCGGHRAGVGERGGCGTVDGHAAVWRAGLGSKNSDCGRGAAGRGGVAGQLFSGAPGGLGESDRGVARRIGASVKDSCAGLMRLNGTKKLP
jgi:hypothetical protein